MAPLQGTGLAAVTTDSTLHLYYQDDTNTIFEAISTDGKTWPPVAEHVRVATDAKRATPITAYYIQKDVVRGNKAAIHVFYMDKNNKLVEVLKGVTAEDIFHATYKVGRIVSGIDKNSRLASGSFNGSNGTNPKGSQWVYFAESSKERDILEIRRMGNQGLEGWYSETALPEGASFQSGAALACNIVDSTIDLYFQNQDERIMRFQHRGSWSAAETILPSTVAENHTPIATVTTTDSTKTRHLFVVGRTEDVNSEDVSHILDFENEKKKTKIAPFYEGTNLAAAEFRGVVCLFYKPAQKQNGTIVVRRFDDGEYYVIVPAED